MSAVENKYKLMRHGLGMMWSSFPEHTWMYESSFPYAYIQSRPIARPTTEVVAIG